MNVRSSATWCMAATGSARVRLRLPEMSSSIMASTNEVVPTFRKVATSARLASPTMTCSLRYRCGIGVGLVPGVHDGTLQGGLEAHLLLEELGPLGQLELHVGAVVGGRLRSHLAGPGEDLAGHEVRRHPGHDPVERRRPVHQVVLVGPVRVPLAVRVVLVDDQTRAVVGGQVGRFHRADQDQLAGPVVAQALQGVPTLGRGELGVGVVDVVAGAVGEHGVDEVGLHLGRHRALAGETTGIVAGRLVLEVPAGLLTGHVVGVGVDEHRGGGDGVRVAVQHLDAVLGLDTADLGDGHQSTLSRPVVRDTDRFPPARSNGHPWSRPGH